MKKLRVVLRWTGRTLLVLLAILALFILEENIRGRIMLARYKAELRAKGEKLTLAELDLPKVPKEGNGAPALLEVANQISAIVESNRNELLQLVRPKYTPQGKVIIWHRREHVPNMEDWGPGGSHLVQKLDWDGLAAKIISQQSAIEKMKQALRQPVLRIDVDYAKSWDGGIPELYPVENLGRWLALMTLSALHDGNHDRALDSITISAKLASRSLDERVMRAQAARAKLCRLGLQSTWEALQDDGWTEDQLLEMQRAWESIDLFSGLPQAADVQRAIDLLEFREVATWNGFRRTLLWEVDSGWQLALGSAIWGVWRAAWKPQDELRILRMWSLQRGFLRGASTSAYVPYGKLIESKYSSSCISWRYMYSQLWHSPLTSEDRIIMECETERQMALAAIAIRRYQNSTGRLPENLSALIPKYLSSIPIDRMDGKPLRYHLRSDKTWTLYSVGRDGTDDGGNAGPIFGYSIDSMWEGHDAVWPQPAL